MAINYTKIGWDTSKYVNPTNMNQMDNGIKAACDAVDAIGTNYIKSSESALQKIALSSGSAATVLQLQSRASATWLGYLNSSGTVLGYIGVESNNKPAFYDSASHEIALKEDLDNKIKTNYNADFSSLDSCYVENGIISGIAYSTATNFPTGLASSYCLVFYISVFARYGVQVAINPSTGKTAIRAINSGTWQTWAYLN